MLIDAANDAGGRDNITVVLFRLEEVGAGGVRAAGDRRAPLAAGAASPTASAGHRARGPDQPRPAAPRGTGAPAPAPPARPGRPDPRPLPASPACCSARYYASQTVYFVGASNDGFVSVYRGLPYDLPAGLHLYSVNYESGAPVDELTPAQKQTVTEHTLRSKDDAQDLVKQLETGELAAR